MRHRPFPLLLIALTLVTALPAAAEPALTSGVDRANFNTSVKPGDDFYEYVNGAWIKNNPIPPEYSRWGAFPKLRDDNLAALRAILEDLSEDDSNLTEDGRKLRDFYRTAMDEEKVNKLGAAPLAEPLARINKISNMDELVAEVGRLRSVGVASMFSFWVDQDEKQSNRYIAYVYQGGLGL